MRFLAVQSIWLRLDGNPPARLPTTLSQLRAAGVFPAPAPAHAPVSFTPAPAPVLPAVIPMDVDWTRSPDMCFPMHLLPVQSCWTPRLQVPHYVQHPAH